MTVAEVAVNATAPDDVVEIVGVGEGEALEDTEVGFDEVEPGRFGRSEDGADAKPAQESQEARVIVDVVEVVHDHEQTLAGVTGAKPAEGVEEIGEALLAAKDPAEAIGVNVVEAEKLLGSLEPAICGPSS